ncbi:MAG TPA: M13 family peptidase, partial [Pseudoduganella sp.]
MKRHLLSTLVLSLFCAQAFAADTVPAAAPASGIDIGHMDHGVRPQDDFFEHLNGGWLKTAEIPADKASWGAFMQLRDDTLPQLRGIIEDLQARKNRQKKLQGDEQKIAGLYASYMDEKKLDALGLRPLQAEL